MVPCVEVASVLPSWRWPAENAQCMVLAAWDGEMLPLAALPGRAHTTALELLQGTARGMANVDSTAGATASVWQLRTVSTL
eukprot:Skav221128  [mRNA]  locus=scaffold233:572670:573545:- [translate_table: standard]